MKYFITALLLVSLMGCADSVFVDYQLTEIGFWYGLWHGVILPFAWFGSLFHDEIAIYAVYNNGGWYDFGFALGVGALASSGK